MNEAQTAKLANVLRDLLYYMYHDHTEYSVEDCGHRADLCEEAEEWIMTLDMEYPNCGVKQ